MVGSATRTNNGGKGYATTDVGRQSGVGLRDEVGPQSGCGNWEGSGCVVTRTARAKYPRKFFR